VGLTNGKAIPVDNIYMGFGIQYAKKELEVASVRFNHQAKSEGAGGVIPIDISDWIKSADKANAIVIDSVWSWDEAKVKDNTLSATAMRKYEQKATGRSYKIG
jgi:hypothetical protein